MPKIKLGHCQFACAVGDVEANLAAVTRGLGWAETEGVHIVSFPESFLTGYFTAEEEARDNALAIDGPEVRELLARTEAFPCTYMVGFNEMRGPDIYNSVLVAERGHLLGTYSKALPVYDYFRPGREFPVFERDGLRFGVVICADGGYIEPTRILALKGARVVFAPHYNYIDPEHLIDHFQRVRGDHAARAVENGIYFFRGNSVTFGCDAGLPYEGVGYGDSYLVDPNGEIVVRSRRQTEDCIAVSIDPSFGDDGPPRSFRSGRELGDLLSQALAECAKGKPSGC